MYEGWYLLKYWMQAPSECIQGSGGKMEQSEIKKICLRCMRVSDDPEVCPFCGREKRGQQTWSKALAPGTILNNKILIGNILGILPR